MGQKIRRIIAIVLLILSVPLIAAALTILFLGVKNIPLIIILATAGSLFLNMGLILIPKQYVEKPIEKPRFWKKKVHINVTINDKPIMSDEEIKQEDEEDDEMVFIEEEIEDD